MHLHSPTFAGSPPTASSCAPVAVIPPDQPLRARRLVERVPDADCTHSPHRSARPHRDAHRNARVAKPRLAQPDGQAPRQDRAQKVTKNRVSSTWVLSRRRLLTARARRSARRLDLHNNALKAPLFDLPVQAVLFPCAEPHAPRPAPSRCRAAGPTRRTQPTPSRTSVARRTASSRSSTGTRHVARLRAHVPRPAPARRQLAALRRRPRRRSSDSKTSAPATRPRVITRAG